MPEPSRRLRLFLRCLAALLLGILLLAGAAMVYVQHNSVAITHALLEDFTQRTGLHLHVRSIGLSWLPPAVQADDVRIRIKELDISVRTARLRPRLTALLQGRLELEYVALQNPVLSGSLPLPTLDLRKLGSAAGGGSGDTGGLARLDGLLPGTLQIEIDQGNFSFQAQDASSLRAGNLSCVLHLRGLQDVRGKLQAGLIRNLAAGEEIPVLDLENLLVEGRSRPLRFLSDTPRLRLRTLLHLPPHLPRVRMNLDFTATAAGWQLDHDIQGDLMQDDEPIPLLQDRNAPQASVRRMLREVFLPDPQELAAAGKEGPATAPAPSAPRSPAADAAAAKTVPAPQVAPQPDLPAAGGTRPPVRLERIRLELGEDSATLDGNLILDKQRGPVLNGSLQAHRLSLTRWLGFARDLAPGLQMALDNITDSLLEFELDAEGLRVPYIVAHASGSRFTGSGGVAPGGETARQHPSVRRRHGGILPGGAARRSDRPGRRHQSQPPPADRQPDGTVRRAARRPLHSGGAPCERRRPAGISTLRPRRSRRPRRERGGLLGARARPQLPEGERGGPGGVLPGLSAGAGGQRAGGTWLSAGAGRFRRQTFG